MKPRIRGGLGWMISGRTLGGMELFAPENRLSRAEALSIYTIGSGWFTGNEAIKGRIARGQYADFAVLSQDYFIIDEREIANIESVLTVVAGRPVYAADEFLGAVHVPALPAVSPAWSPVATFGGYQNAARASASPSTTSRKREESP